VSIYKIAICPGDDVRVVQKHDTKVSSSEPQASHPDSICLALVFVAAHDFPDAEFLSDASGNVIVDVHSENSIATACLSGYSLHGWKRSQAPTKNNSN
jgi:hypothetical protein